jgi:hypothetical protein
METVAAGSQSQRSPVLGYEAIQRKRWERGVLWLTWIVCFTQSLVVLKDLHAWAYVLTHAPSMWVGEYFWGILALLLQVSSLAIACCGWLLLFLGARVRRAFAWCTWFSVLVWLLAIGYSCFRDDTWMLRETGYNQDSGIMGFVAITVICWYPTVLLATTIRRPHETQRPLGPGVIWWTTAVAAMLVAAPIMLPWICDFRGEWMSHAVQVFAVLFDNDARITVAGIGRMTGALASFIAFGAIAWTFYRGAAGRWALMVCAALWLVYAILVHGSRLLEVIWNFAHDFLVYRSTRIDFQSVVESVLELAIFFAFPLAIRVALTLSDVRARLEGK